MSSFTEEGSTNTNQQTDLMQDSLVNAAMKASKVGTYIPPNFSCTSLASTAGGALTSSSSSNNSSSSESDVVPKAPAPLRTKRMTKTKPSLFAGYSACAEPKVDTEFNTIPERVLDDVSVPYFNAPHAHNCNEGVNVTMDTLLDVTPLPKGSSAFSSVHMVVADGTGARSMADKLQAQPFKQQKTVSMYSWPTLDCDDVVAEYKAIFQITGDIVLNGANRESLLVFVAEAGDSSELAIATILGMLPFRGMQVAFVSPCKHYVDPSSCLRTPSGLFEYSASQPARMARNPIAAIFGPLPDRTFTCRMDTWSPLKPSPLPEEKPAPFKIGALELPMVTFEGQYSAGVERLASLLTAHFGEDFFPVVAAGQTVAALGYAKDISVALEKSNVPGYYFTHASGESFKRPDAYGKPELLKHMANAKREGKRVVIIAVGGGVNGNCMGTIAALTGADMVEVPTTLMHYNDATTSAKKAFSLVVDGKILSKNILGAFYLPQLVFCISETFLTLGSSSIHAAVGEATKTMSMLGNVKSQAGELDFHNILGGSEFASDFTKIIKRVEGFENLILFIQDTKALKEEAIALGNALNSDSVQEAPQTELQRKAVLDKLRAKFHQGLPDSDRKHIVSFLTTINEEVIKAKAMFLAYSDPFEKYRALLFEYAHTLGHGIEAFMNDLYRRAEELNIDHEDAFRLHGQCVGMAVILAGEMSKSLGHLSGQGYLAHQSLVYLFNRFGGYDFTPLRQLCKELSVSQDEFCEGVLKVVRRDNKRGYCKCAPGSSVDQLVQSRPGCLLKSSDASAELRYLVEISEESQRKVLEEAFEGAFDNVLVLGESGLEIVHRDTKKQSASDVMEVVGSLDTLLKETCQL
jgi:3-dehydroquinate synthetase